MPLLDLDTQRLLCMSMMVMCIESLQHGYWRSSTYGLRQEGPTYGWSFFSKVGLMLSVQCRSLMSTYISSHRLKPLFAHLTINKVVCLGIWIPTSNLPLNFWVLSYLTWIHITKYVVRTQQMLWVPVSIMIYGYHVHKVLWEIVDCPANVVASYFEYFLIALLWQDFLILTCALSS